MSDKKKTEPTTLEWLEEPPRVRTVLVRGVTRRLAFPYVLTVVERLASSGKFVAMFAYSRPMPIMSQDDSLYRFPLVNENRNDEVEASHVQSGGKVCMGNALSFEEDPRAAFWNSDFNECLSHTGVQLWEVLTDVAPEAVLRAMLLPHGFTPATGWRSGARTIVGSTPWQLNRRRAEGAAIAREAFRSAR